MHQTPESLRQATITHLAEQLCPKHEEAGKLEKITTPEGWETVAVWELRGFEMGFDPAQPACGERLMALQRDLLACLGDGETLVFETSHDEGSQAHRRVALLAVEGGEAATTATMLRQVLTRQHRGLRFVAGDNGPHPETDGWLTLQPSLVAGARSLSLGFQQAVPEDAAATLLVPRLFQPSDATPRTLSQFLHEASDLRCVQVLVRRWERPREFGGRTSALLQACGALESTALQDAVSVRLSALDIGAAWEVQCRAKVKSGTERAWGGLLGRVLWSCEAEMCAGVSLSPRRSESLAQIVPTSSLSLLLPGPDEMLASGRLPEPPRAKCRPPAHGILIGHAHEWEVRLPEAGRARHTYIVGGTGTGKTTLLGNLILKDIRAGEGVIVIDPHGELFDVLIRAMPAEREKDVKIISPRFERHSHGFNMLAFHGQPMDDMSAGFVIGELLALMESLFNMREAGGPMFEMYFRNALKLMVKARIPQRPTLMDLDRVFVEADYRNHLLNDCEDEAVVRFWRKQATQAKGEQALENMTPYIVSKLDGLRGSAFLSRLLSAEHETLDLAKLMNRRGILLVDACKGRLGFAESRLLGICLMIRLFACALDRSPKQRAIPVRLYVDEFQNFVTDSMAAMLSEARKFGLCLTLANQTLGQLNNHNGKEDLLSSVLGNVGNLIAFRLGVLDAQKLEPFTSPFSAKDMQRMPNFQAMARILTEAGPVDPLIFRSLWPA